MWAYTTVQKTGVKQNSKHKPKFQMVKKKKKKKKEQEDHTGKIDVSRIILLS
jgi:hypothetical protein